MTSRERDLSLSKVSMDLFIDHGKLHAPHENGIAEVRLVTTFSS
jgi:hypothetical protein